MAFESVPPLVLLHGLGTGPDAWQAQVEALAPTRVVLVPALALDVGFTVEREASRVWAGIETPGAADLCGLSLGALVALRMALDRPERVRRLVLCAGFASLPRRFRLLMAALGLTARSPIRAVFREGRRFDVRRELSGLRTPALVLVGDRDRANLGLSRVLAAELPNAELRVISGGGHIANLDAAEAFTQVLREFLDG